MIAIKGIEMPKSCAECRVRHECKVADEWDEFDWNSVGRCEGCPLIEIVTCQNCKHWHDDGIMTTCDKNIGNGFPKDYYCADAESEDKK